MKQLFTFLIIGGILFSGCKKTSTPPDNSNKTYLISTIAYTDQFFNTTSTDRFTYDDKNRVVEFKSNRDQFRDYKYTYDANNNVTTVQHFDVNGNLLDTDAYTYGGTSVTVVKTDAHDNGGTPYSFTLNSQGQVISLTVYGTTQYTYDTAGNITGYTSCCQTAQLDTFNYDNKKNPLSMIGAKNLHLMFIACDGAPQTFVNNLVQDVQLKYNFAFTYNDAGFPVNATGAGLSIAYTYITK